VEFLWAINLAVGLLCRLSAMGIYSHRVWMSRYDLGV